MLYITVGIPGSGKSTLAKTISEFICEADMFPGLYQNGQLQKELLGKAHSYCLQQVESFMKQRKTPIVQSNTNLQPVHLLPYLRAASQNGYQVIIILPPYELLHYEHHGTRNQQLIHVGKIRSGKQDQKQIPSFILDRMAEQMDQCLPIYSVVQQTNDPLQMIHFIESCK